NGVGIPTLSFDPKTPLTVKEIEEAFLIIYRMVAEEDFEKLVVPYSAGKPAFGGGIAGQISDEIYQKIQDEFQRLEKFLDHEIKPEELPEPYKKAYLSLRCPVPKSKGASKKAETGDEAWSFYINFMVKGGIGFCVIFTALNVMALIPLLAPVLASSVLTLSLSLIGGAVIPIFEKILDWWNAKQAPLYGTHKAPVASGVERDKTQKQKVPHGSEPGAESEHERKKGTTKTFVPGFKRTEREDTQIPKSQENRKRPRSMF
ncbi:MAG TPA: hypothetical protein VJ205_04330, partial [Gammaproteobacteria bacterium]|nr:hypothetical protein [Gammaproteobacteria bacterium]